ncbi:MAG: hypothetical protein B7X32_01470 [Microbacterium sp. 13-71-7]|nr:MAG: hypothetical protein B7X32_01470 [Microbacterium sp. 13-71-7]
MMTVAQAAPKYLEIVCPGNAAAYELTFAFDSTQTARIRSAAAHAAQVAAREAGALTSANARWPEAVRSDLTTLELRVYGAYYRRIAATDTIAEMIALKLPIDTAGGPAAAEARITLHLPVIDPATSCDSTPLVVRPTPQPSGRGASVGVDLP